MVDGQLSIRLVSDPNSNEFIPGTCVTIINNKADQ